jgi:3-oxo-5-alpha-steroid 4-dehydrogenase 3
MFLQGSRRLSETYRYSTRSKSQMFVGHYILGLVFYITVNVAVWIEITSSPWSISNHVSGRPDATYIRKLVVVPCFYAHAYQHMCHRYLFELRTQTEGPPYKLPSEHLFSILICPHYTCEVLIYACMSLLVAPTGRYVNWTLACATVFVAINLGVTANGTKQWYSEQFGVEKLRGRKRMVLWIW